MVSKTIVGKLTVGSNPTPSAIHRPGQFVRVGARRRHQRRRHTTHQGTSRSRRYPGVQYRRAGVRLFGFYAIVTLIPIVVLGVLLARIPLRSRPAGSSSRGRDRQRRRPLRRRSHPHRRHPGHGPTATERQLLVAAADPLLRSGEALKLRLRDAQGHVAFDPASPNRRPYGPEDDEVVDAIAKGPVRLLTHMNADEVDRASAVGAPVIEVYTPIHGNAKGPHSVHSRSTCRITRSRRRSTPRTSAISDS